jgi:hypothetical protein
VIAEIPSCKRKIHERLPDSQNSIVKKERVHREKRKISCGSLHDSQNPIVKRGRVCEKAS